MKIIIRQKFYLFSSIILIGNALLGYAIYQSNQKLVESEKWVQHTERVISRSIAIFSTGNEIKTNSRDFVITNDSTYIKYLKTAAATVFADIAEIRQLTRDNGLQLQRVNLLDNLMRKRLAFSLKVIDIRSKAGKDSAITHLSAGNDNYYSLPIRLVTNSIQRSEEVLLQQRRATNVRSLTAYNQLSVLVFLMMAGFTIVLLITIGRNLLQAKEKEKRDAELVIANAELHYQNDEKEKRAGELIIANKELTYQSGEKKKRAGELVIAKKELSYQNNEKEKRAAELVLADEELSYQSDEKGKRAAELAIANIELSYQNDEKEKRAAELVIANIELSYQNDEKEKRADELAVANVELSFQNNEKEKRAAELAIANVELVYQNKEKEQRASELIIANEELWYQNDEKEKRAAELVIANKELSYQNKEKEKRAVELAFANEELVFQSDVRKIAEKNLSQSESRLKEAQAIARIGNFEVDIVKETEVWSDEMYKIYGINKLGVTPSKELFFSFVHPDDVAEVMEAMKRSSKSYNVFAAEFRFIRNDGAVRYGYSEARFDWNNDKELVRIYGILQDVTDSRLADIERKKMVNDLMTRNNDLEQFAYIISHNLRAPIANILGASSALNDNDVTDTDKKILKKAINTSILKLDDVVQDLNHILQVKSSINETREIIYFSELVDDIKSTMEDLLTHDAKITYDFTERDELFSIKPYIYSIFYNLISNSVKYCRPDVTCSIAIKSRVEKNILKLVFTDNGLGIDLEKKGDQVFGLYKRFHENIEGKGMGLYMVKTQVETLGGKISIKSAENKGTEFIIEFEV